MPTTKEVYIQLKNDLKPIYGDREADSMSIWLMDHLGISKTQLLTDSSPDLSMEQIEWIASSTRRLRKHEPIQYILGYTSFYGLEYKVNKHVLIPRQETEELVDLIIRENGGNNGMKSPQILDIGTGSGCIAISLKKAFPKATINACDISTEALQLARENASKHNTEVHFHEKDILHIASIPDNCDIIVSNPPYVMESEKSAMEPNVVNYEPPQALYVNNNEALVFYTAIIELSIRNLNPDGKLYFEINKTKGTEVRILMEAAGFEDVRILPDLNGRNRFTTGIKRHV